MTPATKINRADLRCKRTLKNYCRTEGNGVLTVLTIILCSAEMLLKSAESSIIWLMNEKTIAMKLLEKQKVSYEVKQYPSTERDAEEIAKIFGVSSAEVYKTLVVVREGKKPLLVMMPAHLQLDLKKLAKAVGEKKVAMAKHTEAEALTGLQVGGISPLALLHKGFPIWVDQSIGLQNAVFISSGQKGINLRVGVEALIKLTGARSADLAVES